MRTLTPAVAFVLAVLIVPSALLAQNAPPPAAPSQPGVPLPAPPPHTPHVHPNRPSHGPKNPYGNGTIVVGPLSPYYATPAPVPKVKKPKAKHTPRPADAPEIFSQHSSSGE